MPRFARIAWFCFAAVAIAGACSQFRSTSDVAPDGGTDAELSDAPADTAPPDASQGDDAGPDCAAPFQFFETFDVDPGLATWLPTTATNGLYVVTSTLPNGVSPVSQPNALFASGTVPDAGDSVHATILKTFEFVPARARLTFALYTPAMTPFAEIGCVLRIGDGNPFGKPVLVDVIAVDGSLAARRIDVDGGGPAYQTLGALPAAAFTNVQIVLTTDLDVETGQATVQRLGSDGTVAETADLGGLFHLPASPARLDLECGIGTANLAGTGMGSPDVAVAVDEVALQGCKR